MHFVEQKEKRCLTQQCPQFTHEVKVCVMVIGSNCNGQNCFIVYIQIPLPLSRFIFPDSWHTIFVWGNIMLYLHFLTILNTEVTHVPKIPFSVEKDMCVLCGQQHQCSWPRDARSQGISRCITNLINPEEFSLSTNRVDYLSLEIPLSR